MFWGSPGSKGIILILGFRTCQGLRCPDTSCASPWQRWGVGAWGEWKRWGVSTFQVDLAAESFFFFFLKSISTSLNPAQPPPLLFRGIRVPRSTLWETLFQGEARLLFPLTKADVTLRNCRRHQSREKQASLSLSPFLVRHRLFALDLVCVSESWIRQGSWRWEFLCPFIFLLCFFVCFCCFAVFLTFKAADRHRDLKEPT